MGRDRRVSTDFSGEGFQYCLCAAQAEVFDDGNAILKVALIADKMTVFADRIGLQELAAVVTGLFLFNCEIA